ncbi:hypothetical protein [Tenacibaculum sp. C7A-26P2]|uniref:hypothetical protein n=1 Tax=Tenacibaculum sp. C7A-26P2 TaxID=3447504 RepID=UPI003F84F661
MDNTSNSQIIDDINNKKATIKDLVNQYEQGYITLDDYVDIIKSDKLINVVQTYKDIVFGASTLDQALYVSGIFSTSDNLKSYAEIKKDIQTLAFKAADKFIKETIKNGKIKITDPGLIKKYIAPLVGIMLAKLASAFTIGASQSVADGIKDLVMTLTNTHGNSLHEISQQMIGVPDFNDEMFTNVADGVNPLGDLESSDLSDVQTRAGIENPEEIFKKLGENLQNSTAWANQGISDFLIGIVDDEMVNENLMATMGEAAFKGLKGNDAISRRAEAKSKIIGALVSVVRFYNQPAMGQAKNKKHILDSILSPYDAAVKKIEEFEVQIRSIVQEEISKSPDGKPLPVIELKVLENENPRAALLKHYKKIQERVNLVHDPGYKVKIQTRITNSGVINKLAEVKQKIKQIPEIDTAISTYQKMLLVDMIASSKEVVFSKSNRWNEGKRMSHKVSLLLRDNELIPSSDRKEIIKGLGQGDQKRFDELKKNYNDYSVLVNKLKLHPQKYVIGKVVKHDMDRSGYLWKLEHKGGQPNKEVIEDWAENIAISEVKKEFLAVPKTSGKAGVGSTVIGLDRADEFRENYVQKNKKIAADILNIQYDTRGKLEQEIEEELNNGTISLSDLEEQVTLLTYDQIMKKLQNEVKKSQATASHAVDTVNRVVLDLTIKSNNLEDQVELLKSKVGANSDRRKSL